MQDLVTALSSSRDYITAHNNMLPLLSAAIDELLTAGSAAQRDPLQYLATYLKQNNPRLNLEVRQTLAEASSGIVSINLRLRADSTEKMKLRVRTDPGPDGVWLS